MLRRDEISAILIWEVNSASARLAEAKTVVGVIIEEGQDHLPQPDGLHRLTNAIKIQADAREALLLAVQRHSGFAFNKIVPEDLA